MSFSNAFFDIFNISLALFIFLQGLYWNLVTLVTSYCTLS